MFHDSVNVTGELTIFHYGEDGKLKEKRTISNLIVAAGKAFIAARLGSSPPSQMTHMAIGAPSINIAPLPVNTTLTTEIARVALAVAGGASSSNNVQYIATFPAGTGTNASITEAGIFSASSNGTMLARTTFSGFSKLAGEVIVISWVITIS